MSFPEALPIIRLEVPSEFNDSWNGLEIENYRMERISTQQREFVFYVSEGLSIESALVLLFNHYSTPVIVSHA